MHTRGVSRDASGRILRAPTTDDDARAVAELITACQLADVGRNEMTIEDLLSVDAESTPRGCPDSTTGPGCALWRALRSTRMSYTRTGTSPRRAVLRSQISRRDFSRSRSRSERCIASSPIQKEQENDFWVEFHPRQPRHELLHEAEDEAADDEQDRVGDRDPVSEGRSRGYRSEQDEDGLYLRQGPRLLCVGG